MNHQRAVRAVHAMLLHVEAIHTDHVLQAQLVLKTFLKIKNKIRNTCAVLLRDIPPTIFLGLKLVRSTMHRHALFAHHRSNTISTYTN